MPGLSADVVSFVATVGNPVGWVCGTCRGVCGSGRRPGVWLGWVAAQASAEAAAGSAS